MREVQRFVTFIGSFGTVREANWDEVRERECYRKIDPQVAERRLGTLRGLHKGTFAEMSEKQRNQPHAGFEYGPYRVPVV